jgi:hypothetical protein
MKNKAIKNAARLLVLGVGLFGNVPATVSDNPCVLVSGSCRNHGVLTVRVEITGRTNGFEIPAAGNEPVRLLETTQNGGAVYRRYGTGNEEATLRATLFVNDRPADAAGRVCYLFSALMSEANDLRILTALLTATEDGNINLEGNGNIMARLHMNRRR